ncbi:MAG: O-antigen ligase family protein [Cetobacterium sp.]
MEKIMKYRDEIEKLGLLGVYVYAASLITAKSGVNIGLGLMTLSALFLMRKFEWENIEKEYKIFLLILLLIPIFDLLSPGGLKSAGISIKQSYRFLPVFIAPIFLTTKNRIEKFLYLISGSILVNCIYGLNVYRKRNWNFNIRYESITDIMNSAHGLVGLSFVVLGLILIEIKNKRNKRLLYLIPVYSLNLTCILLSQTRGAWLAFIGGIVIFALFALSKRVLIAVLLSCVLTISFTAKNLQNNRYLKRFQSISKNDDSSKVRLLMWEAATNIYVTNPVFGTGKDNSSKYYLEYFEKNNSYDKVHKSSVYSMKNVATAGNAHNMYFKNLAEMGSLFFLLAAFWVFVFYRVVKSIVNNEKINDKYWLYLISLSMITAYYITGLTEAAWGNFIKRHVYLVAIIIYISNKRIIEYKE